MRGVAVIFDRLPLIFCDQKLLKGNFGNFFSKKVVRGNAVQIFSNFPAKSLSL